MSDNYPLRVHGFRGCSWERFRVYVHKGNGTNVGYHPESREIYTDDATLVETMDADDSLRSIGMVAVRRIPGLSGWPYIMA